MMGLKEEIKRRQSVAVGALLTPGSGLGLPHSGQVSPEPRHQAHTRPGGDQHQVSSDVVSRVHCHHV